MNIHDITAHQTAAGGRKTAFGANSFLSIGRKGQIVEGVISKVSDRISISFNGTEISVPGPSVQNATEGETRSFRIMDVSKEHIVLKEVGNDTSSSSTRAMMGTTVRAVSYSVSDYSAGAQEVSEAKQQAAQNIAVLTGEDYQSIESEQGALEEYEESALERAIERHKEKRQWQQESMARNRETGKAFRENVEKLQDKGFMDAKSPEEIEAVLRDAGLPVTQSNVARVASAMQMASVFPELSEDARVYILENQLAPTIENLYYGQYCAAGAVEAGQIDAQAWQQVQGQVRELLEAGGMTPDARTMEQAKWLLANELPVTVEMLQTLQSLDDIQADVTPQKVMEQIILAMQAGALPEQALLDDSQFVAARSAMQDFEAVTSQDIRDAVRMSTDGDITLALLKQASLQRQIFGEAGDSRGEAALTEAAASSEETVTQELRMEFLTQRQLEEIRLKLTLQSAVRMADKGISLEVTPLRELVEELRRQEREYYQQLAPEFASDKEQMDLVQETLAKTEDISRAPAQILGSSVRQHSLLTMNVLHRAAVSATVQMRQYQTDYEAVGTQVRGDLGDSIHKAFANIPELLADIGLEDTQVNERAVRILGYNQLPVTEENIIRIKEMDARVNSVIENMKPAVVMELIRQGDNPLDISLEELDVKLRQIAGEKEISPEERYSRYLWRLEQEHGITEQERDGYIGIYRLLHQIDKSDGAVIGAVMESGWDMTLGNLLTVSRSAKGRGINVQVDDSFGGLEEISYERKNITQQIESGFNQGEQESEGQSADGGETQTGSAGGQSADSREAWHAQEDAAVQYYERLVHQVLQTVTPAGLQQISDSDMEKLLHLSLEMFQEKLEQTPGNPQLEQQLYQQLAEQLRETVEQGQEAVRYLEQRGIPDTIENIQAAERLIHEGYDVYREIYDRRKRFGGAESEESQRPDASASEAESLESLLLDSMEDEQTMAEGYEAAKSVMEEILNRAYARKDITSEELGSLRQLSQGIALQSQLVRRHSYNIPIETGDTVTSLNVTLIQGDSTAGRVQIFLEDAHIPEESQEDFDSDRGFGRVSAELRMSGDEVKGLILCENRAGYDSLSGQRDALEQEIEDRGFSVRNISYSIDSKSRMEALAESSGEEVPTQRLYQLAKLTVRHIVRTFKAMAGMEDKSEK